MRRGFGYDGEMIKCVYGGLINAGDFEESLTFSKSFVFPV